MIELGSREIIGFFILSLAVFILAKIRKKRKEQ